MTQNNYQVGSVVLSGQGRDKGNFFVVVKQSGITVFIADGELHRLSSPKKKNIKHVSFSGVVFDGIADKINNGKKVFDSEIKSALRQFAESKVKQEN